ncbi:MAG: amidohydrolase [Rhodobacteraceae bacterium]|nr:amidohydrolase [Paracoccaceae bacterium]
MNEHPIWPHVERHQERLHALSDAVWATPETCYGEEQSVAAHIGELEHQGFRITRDVADIATAVIGEAGEGGPVIAFLGEYDALAALSQEADVAEPKPVEEGGSGHGCGHHMLGSAAMLAAIAVRDWLAETGTPGRVRYIGCPAEEGGAAKAFMVKAGVFDDVDIAITWHPGAIAQVMRGSSLAAARVDFTFTGRASHAAASPHLGRSALDAVELMNVGVNYMREHMSDQARVHYAYIDAGGTAPNVVQANAEIRYVIREPSAREMMKLIARVENVAKGAAMMTETEVKARMITVSSDIVPNGPLCDAMQANMEALGAPPFSDADREYAAKMQATMNKDDIAASYNLAGINGADNKPLADFLVPTDTPVIDLPGSTDVGDVSWVVPTVQLWGANYAIGTPFHSWQMVAQGKSQPAIKGMFHAAKIMAATGIDVLLDPDLRARAKADLAMRVGPEGYLSPLPDGAQPPIEEMR